MKKLLLSAFIVSSFCVSCGESTTNTKETEEINIMDSTAEKVKDASKKLEEQTEKVEKSLEELDKEFEEKNN